MIVRGCAAFSQNSPKGAKVNSQRREPLVV